jgi:uncharacterized protein YcbX
MAGEPLGRCRALRTTGIPGDRVWAVRDEAAGEIRGAKKIPGLLRCAARCRDEPLGDESPPVEITLPDGEVVASDGPGVSEKLSRALERKVRLCARQPAQDLDHYRRAAPITDVEAELREACGLLPDEPLPVMDGVDPRLLEFVSPPGTYFDGTELHLITTASLASLARLAPASRIDVRRFRPNLVVETDPELDGFPELDWVGRELRIGGVRARVEIPMMRCAMVTWAQADLPKDPGLMRTLVRQTKQNRGIGLSVSAPGELVTGDPVELL